MSSIALETHDLSVIYKNKPALYGVDVAIEKGNLVGIIGPNGAGKSTFIKAAIGLTPTSGGWSQVFGKPVAKVRKNIGYVPQRESVDWDFPINVFEATLMGTFGQLGLFGRPKKEHIQRAEEALEKVGLSDYAGHQIGNLSGGQQQRVFLARALAQDADLYLMDEPFAAIDAATEATILQVLKEMKNQGKTVIVVHHDLQAAQREFDHLMMLNLRLIAYGKTEEVFTAKNLEETYGGRLTILSSIVDLLAKSDVSNLHAPPTSNH